MRRVLFTALLVVVAAASCTNPFTVKDVPSPDKAKLQERLAKNPGVPFVLPTAIPSGYQFLGPTFFTGIRDGRATARGLAFAGDPFPDRPVINFCIEHFDPDRKVCNAPPERGQKLVRRHHDLAVSILISEKDQRARETWSTVPLTSDLNAVPWL